jgi:hypothetical protein
MGKEFRMKEWAPFKKASRVSWDLPPSTYPADKWFSQQGLDDPICDEE